AGFLCKTREGNISRESPLAGRLQRVCRRVRAQEITDYNKTVGDFHGQYCTLTVTAHLGVISLPLSIGTCLPDSCHPTSDKIQLKNQTSFRHIGKSANPIFTDAKLTCQPKFEKFTTAAIFVM
ncbi:hypothetical protein JTE90_026773, partial [Oedothorax gibbosus]